MQHGLGARDDSRLKEYSLYSHGGIPMFDDKQNFVHFDKKCRGDWMRELDKSAWVRRSSLNGNPVDFKTAHPPKKPTDLVCNETQRSLDSGFCLRWSSRILRPLLNRDIMTMRTL